MALFFVALGAFGAHVLSKSLGAVEMGWIQTGLEYQAFHTLAIFGLAVAMQASDQHLVLLEQRFSGAGYCAVQRQPLLSGTFTSAPVGVCYTRRRRQLPGGVGINVYRSYPSETQGRCS